MKKIVRATFLHWHLVLDTTITHFLAIYFAHIQRFDLAAGVTVTDSILKLALMMPCAAVSTRLGLRARMHLCVFLRPALTLLWLVGFSLHSTNTSTSTILTVFSIFKLLLIIDMVSSSDFVFLVKDNFGIDPSQNNSIQNIISRASIAVAPAFSLSVINHTINITHIIIPTITITIISTIILKSITRAAPNQPNGQTVRNTDATSSPSFFGIFYDRYMRWGLLYQIFVNLSFGGITYLLIVSISTNINSVVNELSILYSFFFLYSLAISFLGDAVVPAHRLSNVAQVVAGTAVLSIVLSISRSPSINLMLCGAMGLLYAYELAAIQKLLTPKLRGSGYVRYSALSKTGGRAASASGVALLCTGIESGIASASLFLICGLSGLCCAVALHISNPERRHTLSPNGQV